MLRVDRLAAGHGQATVLREVSFDIPTGGLCTVVGANGAGKTTLVHTLAGLQRVQAGAVYHNGVALHRLPAHLVSRVGVALVPQGRRVFASLTVAEHLALAGRRRGPWTAPRILKTLPALEPLLHRHGGYLSGGEQQMLAIARALATHPSLLLLDEPTEGLAPSLAATVTGLIATIAAEGVTVLTTATSTPPARRDVTQQIVVRLHAGRATTDP